MPYATESERLAAVQRLQDVKQALKGGVNVEKRTAVRERIADRWVDWFRQKMDRGADPVQVLPELAAEIELRAEEAAAQAVKQLEAKLLKALK